MHPRSYLHPAKLPNMHSLPQLKKREPPSPLAPRSLSPLAAPYVPLVSNGGRSKMLCWRDETPSSTSTAQSPPATYRDVVLQHFPPARPVATPQHVVSPQPVEKRAAQPPTPRCQPRQPAPDDEGWVKVQRRGRRKSTRSGSRLPRVGMPADLRGKCFSYPASDH